MMSARYSTMVIGLALTVSACETPQPNYCPPALHHNCMDLNTGSMDAGAPDSNTGCHSDGECGAKVCDLPSGACVQCTSSAACSKLTATPVCAPDHTCRACAVHADCESEVCLPTGACVADADVAYVVANRQPQNDCTRANPCGTLQDALKTGRSYIKVGIGTIIESDTRIDGGSTDNGTKITILADPGGGITADHGGAALTIQGAINVEIYDLEITGSDNTLVDTSPNNGEGIHIASVGSGVPFVHLVHVKVNNHLKIGIEVTNGNISIERSLIFANKGGGIKITNGMTTIYSSLIYRNGDYTNPNNGSIGGISLSSTVATLKFDTIADNIASTTTGGIKCSSNVTSNMEFNILWRNRFGSSSSPLSTNPQISTCDPGNSFISIDSNNLVGFENPNENDPDRDDYHLTQRSPSTVIGAVTDSADCMGLDLDGNKRLVGQRCDYGAYERTP